MGNALAGAGLFLFTSCAFAQSAGALPSFEVASVKPASPPARQSGIRRVTSHGGPGTDDPGQITYANAALKQLIIDAYGVKLYQVSGPDWLETERFDIVAKVPPGSSREQVKLMLRNLLAERFNLRLHRGQKEVPDASYLLMAGKVLKIRPSQEEGDVSMNMPNGNIRLAGRMSMEQLARFLSLHLDRPVADETGLHGVYDLTLYFAGEGSALDAEAAPLLLAAVQEQLGLRLERKAGPVDLLTVGHVERTPTEN